MESPSLHLIPAGPGLGWTLGLGLGWILRAWDGSQSVYLTPEPLSHPRAFITSPSLHRIPAGPGLGWTLGLGLGWILQAWDGSQSLYLIPESLSLPRAFIAFPTLYHIPDPLSHPRAFISPHPTVRDPQGSPSNSLARENPVGSRGWNSWWAPSTPLG